MSYYLAKRLALPFADALMQAIANPKLAELAARVRALLEQVVARL